MRRPSSAAALIAAVLALFVGCDGGRGSKTTTAAAEPEALTFVGSDACAECHAAAAAAWRGSQHARAMQVADPNTVRGDFAAAGFATRDGRYVVHAAGPDGAPA